MTNFDKKRALETGRAMTREGRLVFGLRAATEGAREILIGQVTADPPPYKPGILKLTGGWWSGSGLGINGDDDLVNIESAAK